MGRQTDVEMDGRKDRDGDADKQRPNGREIELNILVDKSVSLM